MTRIVCAWCGVETKPGPAPTSHGICEGCAEQLVAHHHAAIDTALDERVLARRLDDAWLAEIGAVDTLRQRAGKDPI